MSHLRLRRKRNEETFGVVFSLVSDGVICKRREEDEEKARTCLQRDGRRSARASFGRDEGVSGSDSWKWIKMVASAHEFRDMPCFDNEVLPSTGRKQELRTRQK